MPDEAGAGSLEQQNEPGTPVRSSNSGPNATDRGEKSKRTTRSEERKLARVTRGWSLFFQGAVALATLVYVVFSVLLWIETRKAVELTRRSVEATEKALAATEESNRLTAKALDATEVSNRLTQQGIETTKSLGEESNRLTSESLDVSRRSADAAERALKATERAYLTVARMDLVQARPGEQLIISAAIENSGRITARIEKIEIRSNVAPEHRSRFALSSIGPGRNRTLRTGFDFEPTMEYVERLKEGEAQLYVWGQITYADELGSGYVLPICSRYVPEPEGGDFVACETVSEEDQAGED